MNKRFNIRAAFEEAKEAQATAQLEVDKEAAMTPEEKAIRDTALQLASTTDESAAAKEKEAETVDAPADTTDTDTIVATDTPTDTDTPVEDEPATDDTPEPTDVEEAEPKDPEAKDEEKTEDVSTDKEFDFSKEDDLPPDPESEEGKDIVSDNKEEKEQEKEAVGVAASLESIACILERSLDRGGLTTMSASATGLVLEQLYERVGLVYKPASFPALESYESVSSRKRNTEIALESVVASINTVWESISKSIGRAAKRIREMARMFAYAFRSFEGSIKSIRSILPKLTKEETKLQFTSKKHVRNLSYDNKFNPTAVITQCNELTSVAVSKAVPDGIRNIKTLINVLQLDSSRIDVKEIPQIAFDVKSFYPFALQSKNVEQNNILYTNNKLFLDRYSFEAVLPKANLDTEQYQQALVSVSIVMENREDYKEFEPVNLLARKDIISFLNNLQSGVIKTNQFWNSFNALETSFSNLFEALDNNSNIGKSLSGNSALGQVIGSVVDASIKTVRDKLNSSIKRQVILSSKAIERTYFDYIVTVSDIMYESYISALSYANTSAKAYL